MSNQAWPSALSLDRIREAADVIPAVFKNTPQFEHDEISNAVGCRVVNKVEIINPIRSFKGRGASYLMHCEPRTRDPMVTASAGNFGKGLDYAARLRDQRLIIYAATTANPEKITRMRALGAEVRIAGHDFDTAKEEAKEFAVRNGLRFIEDGREPAIAEGAGTIGLELCRWPDALKAVFVPVGNGALINGVSRWMREEAPECQVIGVCPENAPAMARSWRTGELCMTDSAETAADGIAIRIPIWESVAEMRASTDEVVLVSDERLRSAVATLHSELGLVVEPSGAAGLAAACEFRDRFADGPVAIILTGGNLAKSLAPTWLCDR
jgi:threonine dehydratase